MDDEVEALVAEQIAYYRAHAPDYDAAYLDNDWDRCIEELPIIGDVLELACGTGHWTPLLAARAHSVTALDAAPEVLAQARQRVRGLPVEFIHADLFTWQPSRRFDTAFFGFWLTHVPPARFAAFWSMDITERNAMLGVPTRCIAGRAGYRFWLRRLGRA